MTALEFPPLGRLQPDDLDLGWHISKPVRVPYFGSRKLPFVLEQVHRDRKPEEFAAAVKAFLRKGAAARTEATPYVYRSYADYVDDVGDEDLGFTIARPASVWKHVHPTKIHLRRRHRRDKAVYLQILAECDWEEEHGLQIVYRAGSRLSRVSNQDGHLTRADAFALPEKQDRIY